MADPNKLVSECVPGDFFVDQTCINCDTCRQLAPSVFADQGNYSYVKKQPISTVEIEQANQALLCCPTASIGSLHEKTITQYIDNFPLKLVDNIFYCGFNSRKSYGANSYFIEHADGNWLIDSPRYTKHLQNKFEQLGGIKYIFLTHRDDVADSEQYAHYFGATRIIHKDDLSAAPNAELIIEGQNEYTDKESFSSDFKIIPVAGHTQGHMVLLFKDRFLFTGDHLAYDPESDKLIAFEDACWYSWNEQRKSMKKLLSYSFDWIFTGHGSRVNIEKESMKQKLSELIQQMK